MANNSYQPAAGYLGEVVIVATGGSPSVSICANQWDFEETVDALDVTSFCSNGYKEYLPGLKDATFTFSGIWDFAYNPFSTAPTMKIGTYVKCAFYPDAINHNGIFASTAQGLITDWKVTEEVGGTCHYTCTIKGNWTFKDFANTNA